MWNRFLLLVKAGLPLLTGLLVNTLAAQQHVIVGKDNTRPEIKRADVSPAFVSFFSAKKWNGYNEISWNATSEANTRRYIIEYSRDGINYQSAQEIPAGNVQYVYKHHILEDKPMLYRLRSEQMNGTFLYSPSILVEGIMFSPVKIYPTVVTGRTVNVIADWPVERIEVYSTAGSLVMARDVNGRRDYMSIKIPGLPRGIYYMSFYGRTWKTTEKFVVG